MLVNALRMFGGSIAARDTVARAWDPEIKPEDKSPYGDWIWTGQIQRMLSRYVIRQLGQAA
jgi:hypothetical protein